MAGFAHRGQRGAPSTPFTSKLSPRQIATKAMTLGCKKLDRDDKRSRPQYNVRERLLLCNTIAYAEQVLNQRTRRTNRRVMSMEDDDTHFDQSISSTPSNDSTSSGSRKPQSHREEHSPLRSSSSSDDEDDDEEEHHQKTPTRNDSSKPHVSSPPPQQQYGSLDSTDKSEYLHSRDCRNLVNASLGSPIVAL